MDPAPGHTILLRATRERRASGFVLIEMMISITLGLFVMLAVVTLFGNSSGSKQAADTRAQVQSNGRQALALLSRHLRQSGYMRQSYYDSTWMVIPASTLRPMLGCTGGFVDPGVAVPACRNDPAAPDGLSISAAADITESGLDPALREVSVDAASRRGVDCLGAQLPVPADPASSPFLIENRFWVATNASTGRSELWCRGGAGGASAPVVDGIEDLVITWSVDRVATGASVDNSADMFDTAMNVPADAWTWGLRQVVAAQLCLVARSPERSTAPPPTFTDCRGQSITPTDGFARAAFRSTVVLRNHVRKQ